MNDFTHNLLMEKRRMMLERHYGQHRKLDLTKGIRVEVGNVATATPIQDAIRAHKLPIVAGGQLRSDESVSADGKLLALTIAALILSCMALWAGNAMFQMARGL